jgi:ATP-dependent exoDNAse (exonuclease V) beta subunit
VTQIADLGADAYESYYGQRFRRSVLHDAPGHISPVPYPRNFSRLVGEMVHEALRWWQPGTANEARLDHLLNSYAWEQGILDVEDKARAVEAARALLEQYIQSEIYAWLAGAVMIRRELPFIYDTGSRIIHGVIDTLFQQANGRWAVLDYKTSRLHRLHPATLAEAAHHARRYHMQVGAYAAAVAQQLKVDADELDVYIHYIRHGLTVRINAVEWTAALNQMESVIGRLVGT